MTTKSKRARVTLPCDVCGRDLVRLKNLSEGWVSWWTKDAGIYDHHRVEHFFVTCHATIGSCSDRVEAEMKALGLLQWDHHLSVFAGKHAMRRMQGLLWDYDWVRRSDAHRKMLDFFAVAALLLTTAHGDECEELDL